MTAISFKAKFISTSHILEHRKKPVLMEKAVSFVELSPNSSQDMETMLKVSKEWGWLDSFANNIRISMSKENLLSNTNNKKHYYALTTQGRNHETLDSNKILGIAEIEINNLKQTTLNYIQTHPDHEYGSCQSNFKHIGQSLLKCIIDLQKIGTEIKLNSVSTAYDFYKKMGFKQNGNTTFFHLIK